MSLMESHGKEHDKLFDDLEALNEEQIEWALRLAWGASRSALLVQHYLYDLKLNRIEAAFLIADGAMVAAMAAAFIAFLAPRRYGFQPLW
jgi:hypothetical protein